MKFLKPILSIFAIAVIASCGNANSSSSSAPAPTDSIVTTEQETEEEEVSGIRVPDIKLDSLDEINYDNLYCLFRYYENQMLLSSDGKPVISPVNTYGLVNTKRIKKVDIHSQFYHLVKKGEKYYDWKTDSGKIAVKDTKVYECEATPYLEFYEFDTQGRIVKYGEGHDVYNNYFYQFITYKYQPNDIVTYKYEIKENDAYSSIIINGKWDGSVWTEEIQEWDYENNNFKAPIKYILKPLSGHPDFFTINTVEGNHPIKLKYRFPSGVLNGCKPGEIISDEALSNDEDINIIKEDKDSHGNYRTVTIVDLSGCNQEIQYEITYR